ncbi:MAG TPA: hypothetical protein VE086_03770 [Chthoniobacterales bacterium]|nr:hypothetical protein [Chthoniobacterales bacterium]
MSQRLLVFVLMTFVAFAAGGCASKSRRNYEEMEMPLQTGSVLHRHVQTPTGPKEKPKTKKKETEKEKTKKPEAEPSATPKPEEESTPPPDRFR